MALTRSRTGKPGGKNQKENLQSHYSVKVQKKQARVIDSN
jgi:hypothetical protein